MLMEPCRAFGIKEPAGDFQNWKFIAYPNQIYRFTKNQGSAVYNISGKWDVTITRANGTPRKAIAEFEQNGDKLTGSFITPSGDYRFLEGIVTGDSLKLSTFDGSHAYTFYAKINSCGTDLRWSLFSRLCRKRNMVCQ